MADNNEVDTARLHEDLHQRILDGETGLYMIVTEDNLAILVGITRGNITRLHCRSLAPREVVELLQSGRSYRLNFTYASGDEDQVILSGQKFLEILDKRPSAPVALGMNPGLGAADDDAMLASFQPQLVEIASEYIGMAAEYLIEDAYRNETDAAGIIGFIRDGIPHAASAEKFELDASRVLSLMLD